MIKAHNEMVKKPSAAEERASAKLIRESSHYVDRPVFLNDQIHAMKICGQKGSGHDPSELMHGARLNLQTDQTAESSAEKTVRRSGVHHGKESHTRLRVLPPNSNV